uniref:BACK domain-containing protein n=1 Tax=Ascaris lumbricoides TaxID=6252 RepID=A0A0M3IBC3_ASCLU
MVEEVRVAELIQLSLSTLQLLCRDPHLLNQIACLVRRAEFLLYRDCAGSVMLPTFCLYQRCIDDENLKRSALGLISELALHPEIACLVRRAEFLLYRDCAGSVMLPTFCLYQRCIDDENLKRSALGLISELALHPEMAATYASDNMLMSAFEHYSRSRNQAFATYAEKAYERTMQGGNPEFIYPGVLGPAAATRPPIGNGPYSVSYPQSQQYPPDCGPTGTYTSHPMQCPQQTPSTYPNDGTPHHPFPPTFVTRSRRWRDSAISEEYGNEWSGLGELWCRNVNVMVETRGASLMATHGQVTYGREGPSQQCTSVHSSMDYSSEDLSGLSINDDPFASMFCSQQFDSPQQRSQQQARAMQCHTAAAHLDKFFYFGFMQICSRGHETTPGALYCSPGPPGPSYDQRMQNMPMGSPEAPASWHDPSSTYGNYQM